MTVNPPTDSMRTCADFAIPGWTMNFHEWLSHVRVFSIPAAICFVVVMFVMLTCWLGTWVMLAQRL